MDDMTEDCDCAGCRALRNGDPPNPEQTVVGLTSAIILRDWNLVAQITAALRAGYLPDQTDDEVIEIARVEAVRMQEDAKKEAIASVVSKIKEAIGDGDPDGDPAPDASTYVVDPAEPILA